MKYDTSGRLKSALRALAWGALAALALGAVVFVIAFVATGFSAALAGDWVRRIVYLVSGFALVVGAIELFVRDRDRPGKNVADKGARTGDNEAKGDADDKSEGGGKTLSREVMLLLGSASAILVTYIYELVYLGLLGLL